MFLTNLVLFVAHFIFANSASTPEECAYARITQLRAFSKDPSEGGIGADSCEGVLDNYDKEVTPWCSCFKWPQVVDLVTDSFEDCYLSSNLDFSFRQAMDWCDEDIPCTDVTDYNVCRSKNCLWDDNADPQCTGKNTTRMNNDTLVSSTAVLLEAPWITDCDMLVAVYDKYHDRKCEDEVPEIQHGDVTMQTTLRDICGETCWFQDDGAPYVFDGSHKCLSHADCNGGSSDIHDYFCTSCDQCKAAHPANMVDECGLCALTLYNETNICMEMQQCTAAKSYDGRCASQTSTGVDGGNRMCTGSEVLENSRIDACFQYFNGLDDLDVVAANACPCHEDENFDPIECAWDLTFLYTLKEVKEFCTMPCNATLSRDACLSSSNGCVWLNRLVKGKCVDDPCDEGAGALSCNHDSCLKCSTNALGQQSCIVDMTKVGQTCNDEDSDTDKDVCTAELSVPEGKSKVYACKGVNAEERLEEDKKLCRPNQASESCCENGEEYRCAPPILNYTVYAGGHCDNATEAVYQWIVDGECRNVITTEARSRKIYFRGNCHTDLDYANITSCSEEEYWQWLASQTGNFVPFEDSSYTFGVMLISSLLFIFFV